MKSTRRCCRVAISTERDSLDEEEDRKVHLEERARDTGSPKGE